MQSCACTTSNDPLERRRQQRDRAQDPLPDRLALDLLDGHQPDGHRGSTGRKKPVSPPRAERPHRHLVPGAGERLGQRERVHDAAARLRRVASAERSARSTVGLGPPLVEVVQHRPGRPDSAPAGRPPPPPARPSTTCGRGCPHPVRRPSPGRGSAAAVAPGLVGREQDDLVLGGARLVVEVEQPRLAVLCHPRRAVGERVGQADRQARISAPSTARARAASGKVLS